MAKQRYAPSLSILCILLVLLMQTTRCSKDYSYEGSPVSDTTSNGYPTVGNNDTTSTSSLQLPTCISCNNTNELKPNTWMFAVNGTVVCGKVTRAIKNIENTAMTFFGPSACSADTGLIITAYFITPGLSASTTKQLAHRVSLEYYDNVTPSPIADAPFTTPFSLVIEQYNQQTGEATGTFSGEARTAIGEPVSIKVGKFNITFK